MPAPDPAIAVQSLWWGREEFYSREGGGERCPEVIDLTGGQRDLIFGPYIELPAGHWRAAALLDRCPDAARCRLALEFGVYPTYTRVLVPVGESGPVRVELDHVFETAGPAEVRVMLMRAAFHGELRFGGARVQLIPERQAAVVSSATKSPPDASRGGSESGA
jgi:hypothetical protein